MAPSGQNLPLIFLIELQIVGANNLKLTVAILATDPIDHYSLASGCISLVQAGSPMHNFDSLFRNTPDLQLLVNGWNIPAAVG